MPQADAVDGLIEEQITYYRARAAEYDQWFYRQGRYDHGEESNTRWVAEFENVRAALDAFRPAGRVLELACGTGIWTSCLVPHADTLTAVDASPEVLEINRERIQSDKVRYITADLFNWVPDQQYDVVFFSYWLSHVPPDRFDAFWELVLHSLAPGGRVFFIDSLYETSSTATDHRLEGEHATAVTRRLNDGRDFRIVKVFYTPGALTTALKHLGWNADIRSTATYILWGSATVA